MTHFVCTAKGIRPFRHMLQRAYVNTWIRRIDVVIGDVVVSLVRCAPFTYKVIETTSHYTIDEIIPEPGHLEEAYIMALAERVK